MPKPVSPSYSRIIEEAADWFIELEGDPVTQPTRQAFDEWLRSSPEHVRAFLELLTIWESAAATPPADTDADALISRFLDSRSNVVRFEAPEPDAGEETGEAERADPLGPRRSSRQPRRVAHMLIAAAASIGAAAAGILYYAQLGTYATRVAEQRAIVLDDGSSVVLNTRSRIRVRFSDQERRVELLAGQALFEVSKDPARPFIVSSADARIRAVGTRFDVYRKESGTTVTVVEGTVAVRGNGRSRTRGNADHSAGDAGAPGIEQQMQPATRNLLLHATPDEMFLSAGEQVSLGQVAAPKPSRVDIATATAWTQRRMQFRKIALREVVEEFNRYNSRQLRIEDPRVSEFLVSGTFASTDPQSLLRFLRAQPGMRVIEDDASILIESTEGAATP